ncbi:MAG: hypothetical protein HYS05_01655 [Acidobacteria bacterium]|nr:hypothetical protein [Acidobacteriota bacterium]
MAVSLLVTAFAIRTAWTAVAAEQGTQAGGRPASWARVVLATAPWAVLAVVLATRLRWWLLRPWQLRLFAAYAALAWSARWTWWSGRVLAVTGWGAGLTCLGAGLALVALNGLAVGISPVVLGASVLVMLTAMFLFDVAGNGRRGRQLQVLGLTCGVLVAIVAAELLLRASRVGEGLRTINDPEIVRQFHHNTAPMSSSLTQPHLLDEFAPVVVGTNAVGMRGPELPALPLDILLIGDSFVYAGQVAWDETLAPRLTQDLNTTGLNARVASHGVVGWSPLLEWNWYLKVGRRFRPRFTVLVFFWNDLWTKGDESSQYRVVLTPDGRPDHFAIDLPSRWLLLRQSRIVDHLEGLHARLRDSGMRRLAAASSLPDFGTRLTDADAKIEAARVTGPGGVLQESDIQLLLTAPTSNLPRALRDVAATKFWPTLRPMTLWSDEQFEAARASEAVLRRFASDVSADGGRLILLYVPNPLQVGVRECSVGRYFDGIGDTTVLPPDSGIQQWLAGVTRRLDIEFLDPTIEMHTWTSRQTDPLPAPLYLRYDCHWSAAGHRFVADYLARWYARTLQNPSPK